MIKKLLFTLIFMTQLAQGCKEKVPDEGEITMSCQVSVIQNNNDHHLLTKEEARLALQKMEEKNEKLYENLLSDESYKYGLHINDNEDIDYEDEYNEDEENESTLHNLYENWKEEDIVIIEIAGKRGDYKFVEHWVCNLKLGLFQKSYGTEYFYSKYHGYFEKNKNGEWTATVIMVASGDRMP